MFPEVDSITVDPGPIRPVRIASAIIRSAGRALALPPGLRASSFAHARTSRRSRSRLISTSCVSPIAASTFAAGGRVEMDAVPSAISTPDSYPAGPSPTRPFVARGSG